LSNETSVVSVVTGTTEVRATSIVVAFAAIIVVALTARRTAAARRGGAIIVVIIAIHSAGRAAEAGAAEVPRERRPMRRAVVVIAVAPVRPRVIVVAIATRERGPRSAVVVIVIIVATHPRTAVVVILVTRRALRIAAIDRGSGARAAALWRAVVAIEPGVIEPSAGAARVAVASACEGGTAGEAAAQPVHQLFVSAVEFAARDGVIIVGVNPLEHGVGIGGTARSARPVVDSATRRAAGGLSGRDGDTAGERQQRAQRSSQ
jgi:hypothetical protein